MASPPPPVRCAHDRLVPLGELVPHPANPQRHPEDQVRLLAKAIAATGWRKAITVSRRSGFITAGHGRLKAAEFLGLAEVPVDYQDYASEEEELADLAADNRLTDLAETDGDSLRELLQALDEVGHDLELAGWDEREFERLLRRVTDDGPPEDFEEADPVRRWLSGERAGKEVPIFLVPEKIHLYAKLTVVFLIKNSTKAEPRPDVLP